MRAQAFIRAFAFLAGLAMLAFSGWASADPPSRVGRLGYMTGAVSFSPAGESDWVEATINRPLTPGDRLWTDARGRAEIQLGGAMVRLHADTGVSVLNLDDRIAQLQLTQGTLNVRVRRLAPGQVFEVDTPNLAFTLREPGEYRIEVDPDGNATTIIVRKGKGEAYGDGAAYALDSRQAHRFTGTGLREYEYVDTPRLDEFDRWSTGRDRAYDNSGSARYVSPDVVGYEDLDAHGTWREDPGYGNVWTPTRVAAGWAPYRDGHWTWIDPWGWTWVDDAPWGFAVSHYGRWANVRGTWGWVPGPVRTRAYYAPALVAFVGGNNFQLSIASGSVGGVAWFPLAPREVYRPSYAVSRGYYEKLNRSNTVINNTVINNTYNNTNITNVVYANRQVPGAVIAVPKAAFVQSQPVSRARVPLSRATIASVPVAAIAPVAPTGRSMHGAGAAGGKQPPARVFERPVMGREPPAAHVGFAAQQPQLAAKPGHPLDDAARKELKPAAVVPVPVVKVVAQKQEAAPIIRPPPMAPDPRPGAARGKPDERKVQPMPVIAGPPGAAMQGAAPSAAKSHAPAAPLPEERRKSEQGAREGQRGQAAAPPGPPPVKSPAPVAHQRVVAPSAPVAQPPEQRAKPEQRGHDQPGKGDQRGPPAAASQAPHQGQAAVQSKAVPLPPVAASAPVAAQPPVAAPKTLPPDLHTPRGAEPPEQKFRPSADKQKDRKDEQDDSNPQKRGDESRSRKD